METSQADGSSGHNLDKESEQYQAFKKWALQNYGDSGKTKTVTRKKYNRIVKTLLESDESTSAENQKFRFWVKAKGFVLGEGNLLYIPTKLSTSPQGGAEEKDYKRVAVVEDFFDIIYGVHVEMEGRGGKHAGQKRTYRAIAETYAFLPREAVTRFLMSCADCQRRMHGGQGGNNNENNNTVQSSHPNIDFSMPITTTYLNHIRNRGLLCNTVDPDFAFDPKYGDTMSSGDSDLSRSPSPATNDATPSPMPPDLKQEESYDGSRTSTPVLPTSSSPAPTKVVSTEKNGDLPLSLKLEPKTDVDKSIADDTKPVINERKRRASDELSLDDSSTKASEAEDLGKDDDDDDDNDDDLEKPGAHHNFDPERLKSFNMFVRLFVDENLDRMVPISKQPKDKIQAILDACDRQFPEFHQRSRKRVRTYLKSCRRMRRSKEANGWEPLRPTPPHLTSAAAESLLAQACENESENAKRMRMGLEPLPAAVMNTQRERERADQAAAASQVQPHTPSQPAQPTHPPQLERQPPAPSLLSEFMRQPPPHAFRPPHDMPPFFPSTNGLFRPGFPTAYPAHHPSPVLTASALSGQVQNGPTDLSVKKGNSQPSTQLSTNKNQLNVSEVATIKQLIAGYRESASFLYRSADELEQLLMQQN